MRTEIDTEIIDNMRACVMRGFYDEEGEYRKEYFEDIPLSQLPKKAVERIAFQYDLSVLYSEHEVLVIAKSMQDIDEYQKLAGTPRFFHGLLHAAAQHPYKGYTCIASNLKYLRRRLGRK